MTDRHADDAADPTDAAGHGGAVDDDEYVDELPEDLDLTGFVGPHTFPNNNRRRIPAALYLLFGVGCVALYLLRNDDSAMINAGTLWAGIGLIAFALYGLVAGFTLRVEESDALVTATAQVGFPVGHAAAQMVWRGWWSRPTWRILLYSAENPPTRRGIVLVDGVKGGVLEWFVEDNPEDWSDFDPADVEGTASVHASSAPTPAPPSSDA
jgi:hypothetical protein